MKLNWPCRCGLGAEGRKDPSSFPLGISWLSSATRVALAGVPACGLIWKETAGAGEVPWDGVLFEQIRGDYCRDQQLVGNQRREPLRAFKSAVAVAWKTQASPRGRRGSSPAAGRV